jgi:PAS domain S-box-containing protein
MKTSLKENADAANTGGDLIIVSSREITERIRLEDRLLKSERHLAVAQDLSLTGSFSWHVSSGEITWSEQTFRIFGYSPTIKPTMGLARQRIHPDDVALFEEKAKNIPSEGKDFAYEHRLLMPDGTIKHVQVLGRPVRAESGEIEIVGAVMDVTTQRKAEEALHGSADLFRLVIDTIPGLVWSALPDGHIDFLNKRWLEYTGLTLTQANGWGWQAAIHPEDVAGLVDYWKSVLASGKPGETEARLRRFDGAYRWFLFRGVPLYDGTAELVKWYGTNTDIEDRKRVEVKLRSSEAYLAEAQRLSLTGSFGWNVSNGDLVWSDETFCILGFDRSTKPTLDLVLKRVHPEDIVFVQQILDRATREQRDMDFEHRLLMPGGLVKHLHVVAKAAKAESGTVEFVGAVMDITEQKRLENRLRQSERNLAEGQRLTKTGSWVLDYKTGNTDWSVETCRIFGFPDPPPSPHYSEFRARVRPEDREGVDRGLRESFETGEPRPLEYLFVLPDGISKYIETISQPLRDETGAVVRDETGAVARLMGTVMDVTERKAAAEALRASELLARGQLDALKTTLDRLSQESEPDKFLEHVLRTITEQLNAHSIGVWEMNKSAGSTAFVAKYENDQLQVASKEAESSPKTPSWEREHPVWTQFFLDGKYCVTGKLDTDPPKVRVENGQDTPWHDWQVDAASDPLLSTMIKRLSASGIITTLCVPMFVAGSVTGLISIRFKQRRTFRQEEIELTRALSHQAMLAIQLMRLSQQSRQSAVIAERNRMARDIHDTLAQGFTGVIMQLEAAKGAAARGDCTDTAAHIERAGDLARSSLGEARRSVRALRPRSLNDGTLCMALGDLLKRMSNGIDLNAEFYVKGEQRAIPMNWEESLLRIAQESLTNTIKHANARNFRATLNIGIEKVELQLVDDGRGFEPQAEHEGFGLVGMKERVDQIGGQFILRAKVGQGTEILIVLNNPTSPGLENKNEQG